MLTNEQTKAAEQLLQDRPPVVPGTSAIVSRAAALLWYNEVTSAMRCLGIKAAADIKAFCDRAGVAD